MLYLTIKFIDKVTGQHIGGTNLSPVVPAEGDQVTLQGNDGNTDVYYVHERRWIFRQAPDAQPVAPASRVVYPPEVNVWLHTFPSDHA